MNEADKRDAEAHKTLEVLYEVGRERRRQDEKWGEQNHDDLFWLGILGEEFGEVSKAIIEGGPFGPTLLRNELIQVAAVAVSWVEAIDRRRSG